MIFVLDENLSDRLARMLDAFEQKHGVMHLNDRVPKGTADTEWLDSIAEWDEKPVVVAGDGRILKNPAESDRIRNHDIMFVYLASGWTNLPWHEQCWKLVKAWPEIVAQVTRARVNSIFEVTVNGKVSLLRTSSQVGLRK